MLPEHAEAAVARALGQLAERQLTQVEILSALNAELAALDPPVGAISASAFNRFSLRFSAQARRLREAREAVVGALDYPSYFDRLVRTKSVAEGITALGFDGRQAMLHKVGVDLSGKNGTDTNAVAKIAPTQKVFASDTGELTWNIERPGLGFFAVNTPNTKLFTGFPDGRTIALGDVSLAVGKTRLNWATVSLVSRDATGFGGAARPASILLAATGFAANEGVEIEKVSDTEIAYRNRSDWGNGTVLVEGVPATLTLPSDPAKTRCYALDQSGARKKEVPVEKTEGGSKVVIGPQYQTVWYEIEVK